MAYGTRRPAQARHHLSSQPSGAPPDWCAVLGAFLVAVEAGDLEIQEYDREITSKSLRS